MKRDLEWLEDSFDAIDKVYFDGALVKEGFKVKWAPWRPNKKCFIFGRFYKDKKVITINKALAHEWVPDYVILATLYHEMLHWVIGDEHDVTFNLAEEKFVHFTRSQVWVTVNIEDLIKAEKPT